MILVNEGSNGDQADSSDDFGVFDVETGPLSDDMLEQMCPEPKLPDHPGDFNPSDVKLGNTKDKDKVREKIEAARKAHSEALANHDSACQQAREENFAKFKERAPLDSTTGRVVAIGVVPCPIMGEGPGIIVCDSKVDLCNEISGLKLFWQWVVNNISSQRPMVGFNIYKFDLPFLVQRSRILGVPVPCCVRPGPRWNVLFIDLAVEWTFGTYGQFISLDTLAKAFGITGKVTEVDGVEISGAEFYRVWRENRKVAEAYLMADLRIPSELAVRMGVV